MAMLVERRRRGKVDWYVKWFDSFAGRWAWVACAPRGGTNPTRRRQLLRDLAALEADRRAAITVQGGRPTTRYSTPLGDLIDQYLEELVAQVAIRARQGGRAGLAAKTHEEYASSLKLLREHAGELPAGQVDGEVLRALKTRLQVGRKPQTVNKHIRALRAFLGRYADAQAFHQPDALRRALAAVPEDRRLPVVLEPAQLQALLDRALGAGPDIARLVPLLMLTGCRLGEALGLRWADVDLAGVVRVRAQKTGRERAIPLLGDTTGDISPGLAARLRAWPQDDEHVVPGGEFSRKGWDALRAATSVKAATPKALRSTWTSYLVSMGRPPAVVAWWAGHSPLVLERHYADYARLRLKGATLDAAMGVGELLAG